MARFDEQESPNSARRIAIAMACAAVLITGSFVGQSVASRFEASVSGFYAAISIGLASGMVAGVALFGFGLYRDKEAENVSATETLDHQNWWNAIFDSKPVLIIFNVGIAWILATDVVPHAFAEATTRGRFDPAVSLGFITGLVIIPSIASVIARLRTRVSQ